MSLINWEPLFPFDDMEKFFGMASQGMFPKSFMPSVDVYETDKDVMVEMSVPHVDPTKFEIDVQGNLLRVKGQSQKSSEIEDKDYFRKEIRSGSFFRTIPLPTTVHSDKASAVYQDGLLKISLPKMAASKPKQVKVKVEPTKKKSLTKKSGKKK